MATEYFVKLWDNNIIQLGIWQTIYMTALTTIFAYLIGLPLGVILWACRRCRTRRTGGRSPAGSGQRRRP